jgi:hypothetical protein
MSLTLTLTLTERTTMKARTKIYHGHDLISYIDWNYVPSLEDILRICYYDRVTSITIEFLS